MVACQNNVVRNFYIYLFFHGSTVLQSDTIVITCNGGPHCHWYRHETKQESNSLRHIFGSNQFKSNGSHEADEAAVKQAHQQTHSYEPTEDVAQRYHHRQQANDYKR